jgi:hypothetical protein
MSNKRFAYALGASLMVPGAPNGTRGTVMGRSDFSEGPDQYDVAWTDERGYAARAWFTIDQIKAANPVSV